MLMVMLCLKMMSLPSQLCDIEDAEDDIIPNIEEILNSYFFLWNGEVGSVYYVCIPISDTHLDKVQRGRVLKENVCFLKIFIRTSILISGGSK